MEGLFASMLSCKEIEVASRHGTGEEEVVC